MFIKNGIDIECVFLTEQEMELSKIGVETTLADSTDFRPVTFYTIDALYPFYEDGIEYTCLWSGGTSYVIKKKVNQVKELIKQYKLKKDDN